MCQWALSRGAITSCDPQLLVNNSRCFENCLSPFMLSVLKLYLLCQIQSVPCNPPLAPISVKLTLSPGGDTTAIQVDWSEPLGVPPVSPTSYTVKYGTTNGGPYPSSQNAAGLTAVITGLTPNTTYYFVVAANNNPPTPCSSANSAQASATTPQSGAILAADWAARVVVNGGADPTGAETVALAAFYDGLVVDGISSKMIHINHISPNSITAYLTPFLVGGGNDPWVARCGNNHGASLSLTVNGIAASGGNVATEDTGINDSTVYSTDDDGGLVVYVHTTVSEGPADVGYRNDALDHSFFLLTNAGNLKVAACRDQLVGSLAPVDANNQGYFSLQRTSHVNLNLYFASSVVAHYSQANSAVGESGVRQNFTFYFNGVHSIDHGPTCTGYPSPTKRYSFFAITKGLTSAEDTSLYNRVQTLRTALGGGFR
jgi:hypothetical protein